MLSDLVPRISSRSLAVESPTVSDFAFAANLSDIPDSNKLCLELDDRFVVIVRYDDQIFCLDDVCTHDGGPLGEGELDEGCLVCPRHGAKFSVRDGSAVTMPATEPTVVHEVKIEGDQIFVKLSEE